MVVKTYGSTVYGVEARMISIEVNIISGTKLFIVGLPDSAIKESEYRIESVLKQLNRRMPRQRVIVNLAPAGLRKEGSAYDLAIALSILQASKQEVLHDLSSYLIMGELALDGSLRPIRGVLPIVVEGRKKGLKGFILPKCNAHEAAIVKNLPIIPVEHIQEAIDFLSGKQTIQPLEVDTRELFQAQSNQYDVDMSDVKGQLLAKRSLEIAAAGGHNMLMVGPPGVGKTMLAQRFSTILPPLTLREALETSKIYSVTGKLGSETLITQRPFKAPHHTISDVALVGGGSIPQPGQISLAHNGVLFLDELPEFKRSTLEVLRQPLEDKQITITRAKMSATFPANFMLLTSMNPCPCGYYTHPDRACRCSPTVRKRYLNRISGPLFDRIDLHCEIGPVRWRNVEKLPATDTSAVIRKRVYAARTLQKKRFVNHPGIYGNAMIPPALLGNFCRLDKQSAHLLEQAMEQLQLSARAYSNIRKVARTIADLDESEAIVADHIAEAIAYRSLDRAKWGE